MCFWQIVIPFQFRQITAVMSKLKTDQTNVKLKSITRTLTSVVFRPLFSFWCKTKFLRPVLAVTSYPDASLWLVTSRNHPREFVRRSAWRDDPKDFRDIRKVCSWPPRKKCNRTTLLSSRKIPVNITLWNSSRVSWNACLKTSFDRPRFHVFIAVSQGTPSVWLSMASYSKYLLIGLPVLTLAGIAALWWSRRERQELYKEVGRVTELFTYPVKSCKGIPVDEIKCYKEGMEFDRWDWTKIVTFWEGILRLAWEEVLAIYGRISHHNSVCRQQNQYADKVH